MKMIHTIALAILTCAGCNKPDSPQAGTGTQSRPTDGRSAATDIIHTMTQYDKMKAGRIAKERIRTAADAHNKDLDEVTDPQP